jgi:predicted Zn-dependent protease
MTDAPAPAVAATALGGIDEQSWQPRDPAMAPPNRRQPTGAERRLELQRLYEEARRAYQSHDLAGAEHNLRTALAMNPHMAHGYHLLATVLREQKKSEAAIAVLTEGVHRFPNNAVLHLSLGQLYSDTNINSLAIEELQLALSLEPTAPWAEEAAGLLKSFRSAPPIPPMPEPDPQDHSVPKESP